VRQTAGSVLGQHLDRRVAQIAATFVAVAFARCGGHESAEDRPAVDVDDLTVDPLAFLGEQEGNQ